MLDWTTGAMSAGDAISYWRDVISEAVLQVSTEAPPGFEARISASAFGSLKFASFSSSAHRISREHAHIAQASGPSFLISLQQAGQSRIEQGGDGLTLDRGEIGIVDGQRPMRIAFPGQVRRAIAVIPSRLLEMHAPWIRNKPVHKIAVEGPLASLARRYLIHLAGRRQTLCEQEAQVLAQNLCGLLGLIGARNGLARGSMDVQLGALMAFARQHASDPDLSPALIAHHFGMSVRTLHMRFRQSDQSFGRYVLETRLDACGAALKDPSQAGSTVAEIAYRHGFNDLSHFNRTFRARFAMRPTDWRRGRAG
jgi:AraC family transcriptional activator of tynA and feaB